jgi:hypothetical protein
MGDEFSRKDIAALKLALCVFASGGAANRQWLAERHRKSRWQDVAIGLVVNAQREALQLPPWQNPPATCTDDERDLPSRLLLAQMLSHGISRYCADPVAALEVAVERGSRRRRNAAHLIACKPEWPALR